MLVEMPFLGILKIYSHFFLIEPRDLRVRNLVFKYAHRFLETEWKWDNKLNKNVKQIGKFWGGKNDQDSVFRFPISLLVNFYSFLEREGFDKKFLKTFYTENYEPEKATFKIKDNYVLRDYQEEAINFSFRQKESGMSSALLSMPTGTGKTVTLLSFASQLGLRLGVVVTPNYIDKWIADFKTYLDVEEKSVYVVRGASAIRRLFELSEEGKFNYEAIIFSLRTLSIYFKDYDTDSEQAEAMYGGSPYDLWRASKIGLLGGDEVHEQFHAVYYLQTFLNGPFHLGLSATMLHKDPFLEDKQKNIYPKAIRFDNIKMKKYINLVNVGYRFENFDKDKIKTSFPRSKTYSQNAFEGSIRKNKKVLNNFLQMIKNCVEVYYLKNKKEGDKLGIYLSRIELINEVVGFLRKEFTDLDTNRYVEDDPYSNVIDSDIRITTRGSGGTGVDIPNLTTVISFVNVDSQQANIQLLGRLREIKDREVNFIQLYCSSVKKHRLYKDSRDILFKERIKGRAEQLYPSFL